MQRSLSISHAPRKSASTQIFLGFKGSRSPSTLQNTYRALQRSCFTSRGNSQNSIGSISAGRQMGRFFFEKKKDRNSSTSNPSSFCRNSKGNNDFKKSVKCCIVLRVSLVLYCLNSNFKCLHFLLSSYTPTLTRHYFAHNHQIHHFNTNYTLFHPHNFFLILSNSSTILVLNTKMFSLPIIVQRFFVSK